MALTKVTYSMIDGAAVNVLDYGASGNGTDDNTTAFTNALTALSSGGTLYIPAGTYIVNSEITVPYGNIKIEGEGIGATTIKIKANYANQSALFVFDNINNVTVCNLTFDGNLSNQGISNITDNKQMALMIKGTSSNYLISNCYFINWGKDGVYIQTTNNKKITVSNNIFEYIRRNGVTVIGGQDIIVDSNQFYDGKDYAYPVLNSGVWVEANTSADNLNNLVVSNNSFKNQHLGVGIYNSNAATIENVTVTGNTFDTIQNSGAAIVLYYAAYVSIASNTFYNCGYSGASSSISQGGAITVGTQSNGATIVGNTFNTCNGYTATVAIATSVTQPIISGNTFINDTKHGIYANYVFNSNTNGTLRNISNNVFNNGGTAAGATYYCVYLDDTATHANNGDMISNNIFKTGASSGYYGGIYCGYNSPIMGNNSFIGTGLSTNFATGKISRFVGYSSAAPVAGTYQQGEYLLNSIPDSGEYIGWVCTVAGTPGTWKGFGAIA